MGSFIVTDTSDADYYSDSTDCEYEESTGGESSIDEDSEEGTKFRHVILCTL